jgi:hypothetical protein
VKGVAEIPECEKEKFPQIEEISSDHQFLIAEFTTNRLVEEESTNFIVSVACETCQLIVCAISQHPSTPKNCPKARP